MKIFLITFFLLLSLEARENPFLPTPGEEDIPLTSNKDYSKAPLKRATIEIPKYARILQKVTIEYKNLDGLIETKSIELDNAIDWHLPIFISQSYANDESTRNTKQMMKSNKAFKQVASMKHASFFIANKKLKIITKDKIIRDFLLVQPHRIVIDFDKDTRFEGFSKINKESVFSKIRVGNHDKYYRVVLELDGYYRYKMKKISDGYIFELL